MKALPASKLLARSLHLYDVGSGKGARLHGLVVSDPARACFGGKHTKGRNRCLRELVLLQQGEHIEHAAADFKGFRKVEQPKREPQGSLADVPS